MRRRRRRRRKRRKRRKRRRREWQRRNMIDGWTMERMVTGARQEFKRIER
jgi:hypothetical protein